MSLPSSRPGKATRTFLVLFAAAMLAAEPALAHARAQTPPPTAEDLTWTHAAPPTPINARPGGGARDDQRRRALGNPMEISEAAALLAKAGVACRPIDGKLLVSRGSEALYEVACQDGMGWFAEREAKGGVSVVDCLAAATQSKGAQHCLLPGNRSQLAGLQALADKAKATCNVTDGVWIGAGGAPPIIRYEATCADGGGYILDTPKPGTTSDLIATACKDAPPLGLRCTLTKSHG